MDEQEKLVLLYDYYSELFNDKQKKYFEEYYFDNLSLSEISENEGLSRNAIHKTVKNVANKLYEYEDKLRLYEKDEKIKKIINKINDKEIKKELEGLLWMRSYLLI